MSPAKVLLVHNRYCQRGGEDEAFEQEAQLLRRKGHLVVEFVETNQDLHGKSTLAAGWDAIWSRRSVHRLQDLLRREQPDIAHFHNTFARISPAAYYACRRAGVPVIQTLHNFRIGCLNAACMKDDQACERCLPNLLPIDGILNACYRGSVAASAALATVTSAHKLLGTYRKQVDAYIALSEFARGIHIKSGLPASKIFVKPNFADVQPVRTGGTAGYALFVGRLSREKGITTLLKAWENAPLPLRIAGDGPEAGQVEAATNRLTDITWLGPLSRQQVMNEMRQADFLVVPSLSYENCGLCIVEAYSAGLPCVASKLGSMQEIVEDGQTGLLFEPGNPAALAAQVRRLNASPELRRRLSRGALQRFEHAFHPEDNYHILMDIYRKATISFQATQRNREQPAAPCSTASSPVRTSNT